MALSGDAEDKRALKLLFRRPVSDEDRKALTEALNLYQAQLASPPAPAVAVKPLDWTRRLTDAGESWEQAGTDYGAYVATESAWGLQVKPMADIAWLDADDPKAAAQADYDRRRSALVEPAPAVAAPEGWKLMPKRLTEEMIAAAIAAHYGKKAMPRGMDITANGVNYSGATAMRRFWKGLLAAAPQPPATRSYEEGERIERLKAAIEGECDGLAIDDASAKVILAYLDTGDGPDAAIRSLADEPRHEN